MVPEASSRQPDPDASRCSTTDLMTSVDMLSSMIHSTWQSNAS